MVYAPVCVCLSMRSFRLAVMRALAPLCLPVHRYLQLRCIMTDEARERFHFFNTFFYKQYGHACNFGKVESWTKGIDLLKKDFLFVPVHDRCGCGCGCGCKDDACSSSFGVVVVLVPGALPRTAVAGCDRLHWAVRHSTCLG